MKQSHWSCLLFIYSISTSSIVFQNYVFLVTLFRNHRVYEWRCENGAITNTDTFSCLQQEKGITFLYILAVVIQYIAGSFGSFLIQLFQNKKKVAQIGQTFLLLGWCLLMGATCSSKILLQNVERHGHDITQMSWAFHIIDVVLIIAFICFGLGADNAYLPIIYYINENYPFDPDTMKEKEKKTEKKTEEKTKEKTEKEGKAEEQKEKEKEKEGEKEGEEQRDMEKEQNKISANRKIIGAQQETTIDGSKTINNETTTNYKLREREESQKTPLKSEKSKFSLEHVKRLLKNKNYILLSIMSSVVVLSMIVGNIINLGIYYFKSDYAVIFVISFYILICIVPSIIISNRLQYKVVKGATSDALQHELKNSDTHILYDGTNNYTQKTPIGIMKGDLLLEKERRSHHSPDENRVISVNTNMYVKHKEKEESKLYTNISIDIEKGEKVGVGVGARTGVGNTKCNITNEQTKSHKIENPRKFHIFRKRDIFQNLDIVLLLNQICSRHFLFMLIEFCLLNFNICIFMFGLFDIYKEEKFGNALYIYSYMFIPSCFLTFVFGIIADVMGIYNFISLNLIFGISVFVCLKIYSDTSNVIAAICSLLFYILHCSVFVNHMYMFISTTFQDTNFSILLGIINWFACIGYIASHFVHAFMKKKDYMLCLKTTTHIILFSYCALFIIFVIFIQRHTPVL